MKKLKEIIEFIQDLRYKDYAFLFAWYDLWIGFFWDKKKYWLYILPLPTVGIIIKFESPAERDKRLHLDYLHRVMSQDELEEFYNRATFVQGPK